MSLNHLRTFLEVYRTQSLTAAAQKLTLTQPAVSQHIASLENQIGRKLFERGRRGVRALPAADDLASSLGNSLDHAEAVLAASKARSSTLSGVVHIAGPAEYIGEKFTSILVDLAAQNIELRMRLGGRDAIYTQLLEGEVDLALTASRPNDRQLDYLAFAKERLVLVAPVGGGKGQWSGPADIMIAEQPFCAYDVELPLIREWCAANDVKLPGRPPSITIPDLRTLTRLVMAGTGWSVLPDYLVEQPIADKRLRVVEGNVPAPVNMLYLVWARGNLRHPRVAYARQLLMRSVGIEP